MIIIRYENLNQSHFCHGGHCKSYTEIKMLLKKTKARKLNSIFGYDGRPRLRDSKHSRIRSASG